MFYNTGDSKLQRHFVRIRKMPTDTNDENNKEIFIPDSLAVY